MRKREGSLLDFLGIGIVLLAMSVVVMVYLNCTELLLKKAQVSQLARRYILRMETIGYLTDEDRGELLAELEHIGVREVDLSGTTMESVEYGETLFLQIHGRISGEMPAGGSSLWEQGFLNRSYVVEEYRSSTAKN